MIDTLVQWDIQAFLFLNGQHSSFFDPIMWFFSAVRVWIPFYLILLFFIFRKTKWFGLIALVFIALLITCSDLGSVEIFKKTVQRLRPCHNPDLAGFVHILDGYCGGQFGFISSHAANTFAAAMFTSLFFKNLKFSWFIFLWASLVSYSRIYVGVHYPLDILCGALWGILCGWGIYNLYQIADKKIRTKYFDNRK